jgi:hypothetical protein
MTADAQATNGDGGTLAALQRAAVDAQRGALTEMTARGRIGDDAMHVVEEELDLLELSAASRVRPSTHLP